MKFGLGITTYKNENSPHQTPEAVAKAVYEELLVNLKGIRILTNYPAWGIYKGNREPACAPVLEGRITPEHLLKIKAFKVKYAQDSILLYRFTSVFKLENGTPAVQFQLNSRRKVETLQKDLMAKFKLGEYLTYIPALNTALILCVKQFGMDCKDFQNKINALAGTGSYTLNQFRTVNKVL